MINNARGSHSSPGVYTREVDVTYSTRSLGVTTLGLAGETLKGPAFEPIAIERWSEFVDYFGDTSTEKYKGTGFPKYELPYIAKEYLNESRQLQVCRVLGFSGYENSPAWVIKADSYAVAVIRSKGVYDEPVPGEECASANSGDTLHWLVSDVKLTDYKDVVYDATCTAISASTPTDMKKVTKEHLGKFTLEVTVGTGESATTETYPVSLDFHDKDYIMNVLPTDPQSGKASIWVEEYYDYALKQMQDNMGESSTGMTIDIEKDEKICNYKSNFTAAETPWIVSELHANGTTGASLSKLFKIYTISDGNAANKQVKISIQNIKPDDGTFDIVVRDYYDSDTNPSQLEKFSRCTMVEGSSDYVALKIGSADGRYPNRSKYIVVEMADGDHSNSVPAGFLGFPLHKFTTLKNMPVAYNGEYDENIKSKRQYFGMSSTIGVDEDILKFKSADAKELELSTGFHLDALLSKEMTGETALSGKAYCDGEEVEFDAVSPYTNGQTFRIPRILTEAYMKDTIYKDVKLRKFTVYPYGGFDGWDIYRKQRTNTNDFKNTTYKGATITTNGVPGYLDLPAGAIASDYYAYLGAYRQFANPEEIDINLFATPGIDFKNNSLLVEDVIDMIEDSDEGRNGDALYIFTTPNRPVGAEETQEEMYTADEVVDELENTEIDTSYAATYWPWVTVFDSKDQKYIDLPVTKDVVRNMAYTDNTAYPWFAPAGLNRGDVKCVKAAMKTRIDDEDTLYDGHINPVKTFAADGVKIWGNKTAYSVDSPLNRVNVRRLMIRVKKLITAAGRQMLFEQHDGTLKSQFLAIVTPILSDVKANRGISDYRIDVDDSAEARDAHTLPATIHIKPTPTLEYIDLTFTVYPESVEFAE